MTEPADTTPQVSARLLKVIVQPVFVMDDGTDLTEAPGQPIEVPSKGWRQFGDTAFSETDLAIAAEQWAAAQTAPPT